MADSQLNPTVQFRAKVRAAEEAHRRAQARTSDLEKTLGAGASAAARQALALARADLATAEAALAEATAELENHAEDMREDGAADDPLPPQTDYRLREIVAKLSHYQQRATYGAVGALFGASPLLARGWFKWNEAIDNSFVVSAKTGEPRNYPAEKIHPQLKRRPEILDSADRLLTWLQSHPLTIR